MKILSIFAIGCLLMVSAQRLRADVCEDIGHLGDRWHKLANYIDEHSDDGKLRKSEIRKVARDTKELMPPTKALGEVLVKEFKGKDEQRVRAWGKQILGAIEELGGLTDDDDWDEDVKIIDRLVEVIDKVAAECDK
ncbi:MAG: hypothetical protein JSU00_05645 [Acidobacteria bacterium]|nr:hypothetical protein [Acidobacteriota bacterium]